MKAKHILTSLAVVAALAMGSVAPALAQDGGRRYRLQNRAPQLKAQEAKDEMKPKQKLMELDKKSARMKKLNPQPEPSARDKGFYQSSGERGNSRNARLFKKIDQNKEILRKGDEAANKRLLEKLRQNEEIRHKGDEARVKRNLNKLKNGLNRDELARGEEMIRARKAREARKARDAANLARDAKKGRDAAMLARDARKARGAAEAIKRGKQIAKLGKVAGRAAIGATGIGLVVVAGSLIVEGLAGDSAEDMIIDSAYALLAEGKSLNEVGAILGKRLDIRTIAKNIEKNLQQTGKDIEGTVNDIKTGQFLPKAGQKIDQAGKDIGNFFNSIFGGKKQ